MVGTWRRITTVTSTILSMWWTYGSSTAFCTSKSQAPAVNHNGQLHHIVLEMHLEYPNNLLDLLDGRHLSLCHQKNVHSSVDELGFWDCHCLLHDLRLWSQLNPAQQEHRRPFQCVAENLMNHLNHWDLPLRQDKYFDDLVGELQLLSLRAPCGPSAPVVAQRLACQNHNFFQELHLLSLHNAPPCWRCGTWFC